MLSSLSPLEALLSAPSKQAVNEFLCSCAAEREAPGVPSAERLAELASTFGLGTPEEASALQRAGAELVGKAVYAGATPEQTAALFPDGFHADLRELIVKAVQTRLPQWRAESLARGGVSSMPRLQSASWQVYRKPAPEAGGLTTPAMLLSLKLDGGPAAAPRAPGAPGGREAGEEVAVEMSKEQLETMLEGLNKVKEQLASV